MPKGKSKAKSGSPSGIKPSAITTFFSPTGEAGKKPQSEASRKRTRVGSSHKEEGAEAGLCRSPPPPAGDIVVLDSPPRTDEVVVIESPIKQAVLDTPAPCPAARAGGSSGKRGKKEATHGSFGALITHPVGRGAEWKPGPWTRSFSLGYRNALTDRRSPGIGAYRRQWGKRITLNLVSYTASIFGGGAPPKGADVIPIPTPRPSSALTVHAGHRENMLIISGKALSPRGMAGMSLPPEDSAHLRAILGAHEGAQSLLAALCAASHPMCGDVEYHSCRWFIVDDAGAKHAKDLASLGLATIFKGTRDIGGDAPSLLCLLSDTQLRSLLSGRLGGEPARCKDRFSLIKAIAEAIAKPIQTAAGGVSSPHGGTKVKGRNGVDDGLNCVKKQRLSQSTLTGFGGGGVGERMPGGIVEILKGSTVVRASEAFEDAWWRAKLLFFSASGFDQESAAALLTTEMRNLKWGVDDDDDDGDSNVGGARSGREAGEQDDEAKGEGGKDFGCGSLARLEAGVRLSDALEDSVRMGDADSAYRIVSEASSKLMEGALAGYWEGYRGMVESVSYTRVMWSGVALMERDKRYADALKIIDQLLLDDPPVLRTRVWRGRLLARKVQDLVHLARLDAACDLCEQVLGNEPLLDEGEFREEIKARFLRLAVPPRRWAAPKFPPTRTAPKRQVEGTSGGSVEGMAMEWYSTPGGGGWTGMGGGGHVENGFWHQLYGLLFADILLDRQPDQESQTDDSPWPSPCMDAPLDWSLRGFWEGTRKPALEERLTAILSDRGGVEQPGSQEVDGGMMRTIRSNWGRFHGVPVAMVDWDRHGHACEDMCVAARCLGGRVVHAVCSRFARDHNLWHHGLPDLFMLKPRENLAKLVEVKGPGDSLSNAQISWIEALVEVGCDIEVCHVTRPH